MNYTEEPDMPKTYATGFDFGNTEIDIVMTIKGQIEKFSAPTAFVRVDTNVMQSLASESEDKSDKLIIRLEGESQAFALGQYALLQEGEPWNGRGDRKRYASKYALRGLLCSTAAMIPDKEYNLCVVAGLPAKLFIDHPELRKEIKTALDGDHTFTFEGKARIAHVEVVNVLMEGAGALINYPGLSKTSEAAVIDIGGGTTDLYVQHGVVPVNDLCRGKALGVESATAILKRMFREQHKRALTDMEARKIMYAFASGKKKDFPEITTYGKVVEVADLQQMAEEAVGYVAEEISTFIASTWGENVSRFRPILIIGGGSLYFLDAVLNRIEHVTPHSDPTFANAIGYAQHAQRKLTKKLQEAREAKAVAAASSIVVAESE